MYATANVSAPRATTSTTAPQLSRRALQKLRKGAYVEVWVDCPREGGAQTQEKQGFLCSINTALLRHFSKKCRRERTANDTERVSVPYPKEPTKLVVGWMMAGGGNELGTPEVAYPSSDLPKLGILRDLAVYFEIDSLVKLVEKDIAAVTPAITPVRVPTANSARYTGAQKAAPKATPKATPVEKLCWFCNKSGHVRRDCPERNAIHVTLSQAETLPMKATDPPAFPAVPAAPRAPATEKSSVRKLNLTPIHGRITAQDESGRVYYLNWDKVKVEVELPMSSGEIKITGQSNLVTW